jgi:hypothetical protein
MPETGSTTVDAVGREVGHEDASSFSRLTGILPGDYRRRFRLPDSQEVRPGSRMLTGSEAG